MSFSVRHNIRHGPLESKQQRLTLRSKNVRIVPFIWLVFVSMCVHLLLSICFLNDRIIQGFLDSSGRSLNKFRVQHSAISLFSANGSQTNSSNVIESRPTWQNNYGLVHVVHTRIMQLQPHLTHLGRARLNLFHTLTVPSMSHQSTSQFLWIIRTDPMLDGDLLRDLSLEVRKVSNAVLVGSNENPEDFRIINDITPENIIVGSYELVKSFHDASQSRPILETRLDADDALSLHFIESIQSKAAHLTARNKSFNSSDWFVLCTFDSIEWQMYHPWNKESQVGAVCTKTNTICLATGLTYLLNVNSTIQQIPTRKHHKMAQYVPLCDEGRSGNCLTRITVSDKTHVLRARTPTSAGMGGISSVDAPDGLFKESLLVPDDQNWSTFGIHIEEIVAMRSKLLRDLPDIAKEALKGQCTQGHSCKLSAKEKLTKLLQASEKKPLR